MVKCMAVNHEIPDFNQCSGSPVGRGKGLKIPTGVGSNPTRSNLQHGWFLGKPSSRSGTLQRKP